MIPKPIPNSARSENEMELQRMTERAAQLEEENLRLEEVLERNTRIFAELLSNGDAGITLTGPDRRIVKVIKGLSGVDPARSPGSRSNRSRLRRTGNRFWMPTGNYWKAGAKKSKFW